LLNEFGTRGGNEQAATNCEDEISRGLTRTLEDQKSEDFEKLRMAIS
jgi:hypothetical protein